MGNVNIVIDRLALDQKVVMHSDLYEAMLTQQNLLHFLEEYLTKAEKNMAEIDQQMQVMIGDARDQGEAWKHIMSEVYADIALFKLELAGGFNKKKIAKSMAMFESVRLFAAGCIRI